MALSLHSVSQADPMTYVKAVQEQYSQKQVALELELAVVNLNIGTLTNRINALTGPEKDNIDKALRTATVAREKLQKEQASLQKLQSQFGEVIDLKNRELQLEQTIRNLMHQIQQRQVSQQKLTDDINELKTLNCDVTSHHMLVDKWALEMETSSQALAEAKKKRQALDDEIRNLIRNAFELCAEWDKPVVSGSGRDKQLLK